MTNGRFSPDKSPDKSPSQPRKDSLPSVKKQTDQLKLIPPPSDDYLSRFNQTARSEAPWVESQSTQPLLLSPQQPSNQMEKIAAMNQTMRNFGQNFRQKKNLSSRTPNIESIDTGKYQVDLVSLQTLQTQRQYVSHQPFNDESSQQSLAPQLKLNLNRTHVPKIEGSPLKSPFMSKKSNTNGLDLNSKVNLIHSPVILKPSTREQRRQLDSILDNQEYSIVPLNIKTSLTIHSPNQNRQKKPAQNGVVFDQNLMKVLNLNEEGYLKMMQELSRKQYSFIERSNGGVVSKAQLLSYTLPQSERQNEANELAKKPVSLRQPNKESQTLQQSRVSVFSYNSAIMDRSPQVNNTQTIKRKRKKPSERVSIGGGVVIRNTSRDLGSQNGGSQSYFF